MREFEAIWTALERVVDPCSIATGAPINLVDMGMIKDIANDAGDVRIELRLTSPICWQAGNIITKVEEVIALLPGVRSVTCALSPVSDWMPDMMAASARARLKRQLPELEPTA